MSKLASTLDNGLRHILILVVSSDTILVMPKLRYFWKCCRPFKEILVLDSLIDLSRVDNKANAKLCITYGKAACK